jgi:hypothetical protein
MHIQIFQTLLTLLTLLFYCSPIEFYEIVIRLIRLGFNFTIPAIKVYQMKIRFSRKLQIMRRIIKSAEELD